MTTHGPARDPGARLEGLESEFEVLGELGRGGTAIVYRAVERELGREVAIKVVRSIHLDDEEALARLAREARVVATLRHPNIVTLFGTRRLANGGLALIMQCVPGRTLKQAIRSDGPLPVESVLSVIREIGSALHHAHERHGIVHRDIKPENIYLDSDHGHALLADFGIARAAEGESTLTVVGTALGTPAYMSPEQIDGEALDGRSDLYSLGLVTYEMLTGRQPWAGHNLYSIIYKQKHEELPPLSELRPDLPPALLRAIDGLLRKDRDQRWSNAAQFLAQLRPDAAARAAPRPHGTTTAARQDVSEDSPTIRFQPGAAGPAPAARPPAQDSVDPPAEEPERFPPMDVGVLPFELVETIKASSEPAGVERPSRRGWRTAARVVVLLLLGLAGATAAMIRLPYPASSGAPIDPVPTDLVREAPAAAAGAVDAPAAAARVIGLGGDAQRGTTGEPLARPLEVRVEDARGRPVAHAEVEFAIIAGGGTISPQVATSDSTGLARASWTPGLPGLNEAMARIPGGGEGGVTFLAAAAPAGPARLAVGAGEDQEAVRGTPLPRPIEVRVEDEAGHPVDGVVVEFRVTAGGGSVDPVQARSVNGIAGARWTLGSVAGAQSLAAEVAGTDLRVTIDARARSRLTTSPLIAAGGTHTCRLTEAGAVSCWGGNDNGQLGSGGSGRASAALQVRFDQPLARIAAGVSHTCALDGDGAALCWGDNDNGQLGTGDRGDRAAPEPVRGVQRFVALAAGLSHTCALNEDGRAFCWGAGSAGQLGDGTGTDRSVPTPVAGSRRFVALAVGWSHTCGLTGDQVTYCWGLNRDGQIGDGTTSDRSTPTPVAGGLRFVSVSAGAEHTCGVTPDGGVHCWGGSAGTGGASSSEPVPVEAPVPFVASVAGAVHTCGLTRAGEAYCWGRNGAGQLGNGSSDDSSAAVRVAGGIRFTTLTAVGSHTCGRSVAGVDFCWGYNIEGQLGDGSRSHRSHPVRVTIGRP